MNRETRKEQPGLIEAKRAGWILKFICAFCALSLFGVVVSAQTIPLAILPNATVGVFYAQQLTANAPAPLVWSVSSGILPPGISLTTTGALVGTPTLQGTFGFSVQVAAGNP